MAKNPTVFEFTTYEFNPEQKRAVFHYATLRHGSGQAADRIEWKEIVELPEVPKNTPPKKLLEALHIMLGISYYKYYLGELKLPYTLSKKEADFWNVIYKKGLGEFFYKNNLNPEISPKFSHSSKVKPQLVTCHMSNVKCLVGIGGGKDSIVSAELLKEAGFDFTSFNIELNKSSQIVDTIMNVINAPQLKIRRVLDEKVHQKHPYNGHIPISAIYAFLGVFTCALYGYKYFIVSNEHSSNFGNLNYKGLDINHQWSKSFEFETLFQNYLKHFVTKDITYFSLLRPFYEIRIVKMFSTMKKYFPYFSSCNQNFRIQEQEHRGLWCGKCAKCVFAFAMFSAVLPKKELLQIFGENLQAKEDLQPLFRDIAGQGSMKPFDCVGTFEEVQEALGIRKHPEVWRTQKENAVPEEFRFLGMENAYILGYGKEGKITKEYLKKYYPKLKVGVGDEALDKRYLEKQTNWDIAIKTPGINKNLVKIPYTTATNMFFAQVKGKNTIIGVTGSKGKSTTASLIYHILKIAGKNVELLGNIGKPMLESLLKPGPKDRIFVLELSSYQLDDITYSPDIAVVTNLFPEHMDFHGSLKAYYDAKKNIFNFQEENDHLVFRPKAKKTYKSTLLGEHNQNNIQAAVEVAKILEIPEAKIKKALQTFKSLPHRLDKVGTFKGITFYDDGSSTNPESAILAIKALKNIDTIFLGGQERGYDFTELEKTVKKYKIKNIVLFPDNGKKMIKNKKGYTMLYTKSMKEAVRFAYQHTQKGKICLLSGASPSYSLWKHFSEKGDQFKKYVTVLGKK